jgi:undecaprenyl-diphosphatase
MFAATAKKLLDFSKEGLVLDSHQGGLLLVGNLVAFGVGLIAIKSFISLLTRHGFRWFGVYRILIGGMLLLMMFAGKSFSF